VEYQGLMLYSEQYGTDHFLNRCQICILQRHFFNTSFNTVLPSTSRSSMWALPLGLSVCEFTLTLKITDRERVPNLSKTDITQSQSQCNLCCISSFQYTFQLHSAIFRYLVRNLLHCTLWHSLLHLKLDFM
jgi:hypothetical protein